MTVNSRAKAWDEADKLFPSDYIKDEAKSERAGYDIYTSTAEGVNAWICDLGDRLELNTAAGTINIWIETTDISEYQIADALAVIDDAIYEIDDKIGDSVAKATSIGEARRKLYSAFGELAAILLERYPESALFEKYNL